MEMLCACPTPQGAENPAARPSPPGQNPGPLLSRAAGLRKRGSSWAPLTRSYSRAVFLLEFAPPGLR
ncbi:hypothetical protein CapIbe_022253 [Capra ibex]